ncbi:MAG: hypothetical protein ACR2OR_00140 [Hyphomicrobiales bacterium]
MRNFLILCGFFAIVAFGTANIERASAADIPAPAPAEQFDVPPDAQLQFDFVPLYVWIPGFSGDLGVFGNKVKVDVTPIDIISNLGDFLKALDGLYFGAGHLRYGDIGFMYDVTYMEVSSTAEFDAQDVSGALDVGFGVTIGTLLGTYRLVDDNATEVDLLAGARIYDIKLDVTFDATLELNLGPFPLPPIDIPTIKLKEGDDWVDPVVGVKGSHYISERTYLTGWAMVGGFGVGSDFMYDIFGGLGYEFNDTFSAVGGMRASYADYKGKNGFLWDMLLYGPIMGATVRF